MTAQDFIAAGGRVERTAAGLRALAPKGGGIALELRAEVTRRMGAMHVMPPSGVRGVCDGCGDATMPYIGGICDLCALARQKVVRATGGAS